MLKCLCQTEPRKRVGWHSNASALRRQKIPRQFETESRVAIIANEWKMLNDNVLAVQDRGHLVVFEPTPLEVHRRTAEWFWDQEVFDFIGERLHLICQPSMRDYWLSRELKQAGLDWRARLLERCRFSGRRLLAAQLKADPSFATEEERVREFIARGGGCRATYFNHAKKLQLTSAAPKIAVSGAPPDKQAATADLLGLLRQRYGRLGSG